MYPRERLNKGKTQETVVSASGCYSLAHSADMFCCSRSIVPTIRKPEMDKLTKMWILFNLVFISSCQGFRISSCSINPAEDVIRVLSFNVEPSPVQIPGSVTVDASINVTQPVFGILQADVTISKKFGPVWINIPCVNNVGSCTYRDICSLFGNATTKECPTVLKANKLPCSCPVAAGIYTISQISTSLNHNIMGLRLLGGEYHAQLRLTDSATQKQIACLNAEVSVVDPPSPNVFQRVGLPLNADSEFNIDNDCEISWKCAELTNLYNADIYGTLSDLVRYLAEQYPDKELFVFYRGEKRDPYTAREVFELAGKFANRLRHQYGFKRNDVIVNTLPNSPERVITDLGITLAGITCMNGQILLSDGADFFFSARNSRSNGIIVRPEDVAPAWRLIKPYISGTTSSTITPLSCGKLPDLTSAILVSRKAEGSRRPLLEDLRSSKEEVFVDLTISPDDIFYIFTTSGSTGYSKLVPRTHAEIIDIWDAMNISSHKNFKSTDEPVLYSDRLLGWVGGFPFLTYCGGDKRVLLDLFEGGGKRGDYTWTAIRRERCTMAIILPLDFESVLKHVTSTGSTDYKVKILATGGQPLKKSHLPGMLTVAEHVLVGYGSTEAGGVSSGAVTFQNLEDFFCGEVISRIQFRVVDDNGEICKPRQFGTLHLKGGSVLKSYFNRVENPDPNNAKSFTKDGWFNTEDVGYQDENGNLFVMGRNKDTIIYGSAVLYPSWLEAKIIEHPDVAEAAVLPVSDPVLFHEICACVKPVSGSNLTEEKLKSFCESIFLADLSSELTPVPKYYMVLETFPETATGKTDKQALFKMAEERFGVK